MYKGNKPTATPSGENQKKKPIHIQLSQINSKNYLFHTFYCAQTNKVESA